MVVGERERVYALAPVRWREGEQVMCSPRYGFVICRSSPVSHEWVLPSRLISDENPRPPDFQKTVKPPRCGLILRCRERRGERYAQPNLLPAYPCHQVVK